MKITNFAEEIVLALLKSTDDELPKELLLQNTHRWELKVPKDHTVDDATCGTRICTQGVKHRNPPSRLETIAKYLRYYPYKTYQSKSK
ncbi:hypothetical protein J6590_057672 [Homalodisca vitripennis]|nr:hypothetical protein J6590_057672 [Homalodisca vitripennis]